MSIFYKDSSFPVMRSVVLSTIAISSLWLVTACDSQTVTSNSNATSNTDNAGNNIIKNDSSSSTNSKNLPNEKMVSLLGYQKLSFGQVITPELLSELGLARQSGDNEQCYYVSNPKLSYVDKDYGKRASVLYQIIDDKVALITIKSPDTPFYTGINIGDSAKAVMKVHNDNLAYEVDKYAVDGDYYSLIANVKFDNKEDTLPIQIEYHIKGGQKLNDYKIKSTEWTADNKRMLQGQVKSIDIGIPEAIYLVEGCS